MKFAILLSLLSLGVAVGAGAWLYAENQDLEARIASLEGPVGDDAQPGTPGGAPGTLVGSAPRRDLAELRRRTDGLMERMETVERTAQEVAAKTAAPAADGAALADKPAFAEAVRGIVLDMATNDVDFRARVGVADRTKIPKDSPFTKVADTLQLDASQEAQMSKDLQEIQQELFALLSEERTDGTVPIELIAEAEGLKEGDPKRAQLFMQLFTQKIPGGDETYMQRAVKLVQGFRTKVDTYMRPQQLEILNAVEIDWFSIKFN